MNANQATYSPFLSIIIVPDRVRFIGSSLPERYRQGILKIISEYIKRNSKVGMNSSIG